MSRLGGVGAARCGHYAEPWNKMEVGRGVRVRERRCGLRHQSAPFFSHQRRKQRTCIQRAYQCARAHEKLRATRRNSVQPSKLIGDLQDGPVYRDLTCTHVLQATSQVTYRQTTEFWTLRLEEHGSNRKGGFSKDGNAGFSHA